MIVIRTMTHNDISPAVTLWQANYRTYCAEDAAISGWCETPVAITAYLARKVDEERGYCAIEHNTLVGYLAYDEFPFHAELTAFCPIIAHAAAEPVRGLVYALLYRQAAQEWVAQKIYNHMWSIFYQDEATKGQLYNLGFGAYLIDAYTVQRNAGFPTPSAWTIRRAGLADIDELYELVAESKSYYQASPLFLPREEISHAAIAEKVATSAVFTAYQQGQLVGLFHVNIATDDNEFDLSQCGDGLVDHLGMYIREGYRGAGLGVALLDAAHQYFGEEGVRRFHVDFETANPHGIRFWPKHFAPTILSVRRTVNKDA